MILSVHFTIPPGYGIIEMVISDKENKPIKHYKTKRGEGVVKFRGLNKEEYLLRMYCDKTGENDLSLLMECKVIPEDD